MQKKLSEAGLKVDYSETGEIIQIGDGVAIIQGLEHVMASEMIRFQNGEYGLAMNLDEETVSMLAAQHAYEAASRVLTTLDSVLDTLINRTGVTR